MRITAAFLLILCSIAIAAEPAKPRVAFFPLGGNANAELRERSGFSLRAKLDRDGRYEVIDGPKMAEIAAEAGGPITAATAPDALKDLNKFLEADVFAWGDLTNTKDGAALTIKLLDLREGPAARPRVMTHIIARPTDLRFVSEAVAEALPGVARFEHPSEVAVVNDATAEQLWKTGPNLVKNPAFSDAGAWKGIYRAEYYDAPVSNSPAATDKVVIFKQPDGNNVLSMKLSRDCAETNGLACLSARIEIKPDTRYRLSFRYRSDGPVLHVFVKGYTLFDNINGQKVEREIYRRQVPVTGGTKGEWVTIVDELNPQHIVFPVQSLKIDLYTYLQPGEVMFDDVVLKAVGKQTRKAADEAIDKPLSRPRGAK